MKFHFKKNILIAMLVLGSSTWLFAGGFGTELLKNSDLSLSCPFSLVTGDMFKFTKADVGAEVRVGTNLVSTKNNFFTFGIATTYNINWYLFNREEIRKFYTHSILESVSFKFALPKDFFILADIGCGLGMTKVNAVSIDQKTVDNYFNSFVIGATVVVTHKIFNFGPCALNWNAGIESRFFIEQKSCFQSFGIVAGLTLKAR